MDDLKAVVLKLATADNLRSQGYLRSVQNLPKNSKRGEVPSADYIYICIIVCININIYSILQQLCYSDFIHKEHVKDDTMALCHYCITNQSSFVLPFTACFWKYCVTN